MGTVLNGEINFLTEDDILFGYIFPTSSGSNASSSASTMQSKMKAEVGTVYKTSTKGVTETKFEELTPAILNEFVDKVLVHERDRKGSIQTTQEIEIYFNFIGQYIPPTCMTELSAEEQAKIDEINRIKDKRHQEYLRRKASGWQRKYDERVKNEKRAKMQAMKEKIRDEEMAKGVYIERQDMDLKPKVAVPQ